MIALQEVWALKGDKSLYSIKVEPYQPNRQSSIINSNGGRPRFHYPVYEGSMRTNRGVIVAMINDQDADRLERRFDWVKKVRRGHY